MSEKYKSLKVPELKEILQRNGLAVSGKKEDLISRLVKNDERKALESLEKEFELDGDFDENDIPQDIFTPIPIEKPSTTEKESVLSDDEEVDFVINDKAKNKDIMANKDSKETTPTPSSVPEKSTSTPKQKEITEKPFTTTTTTTTTNTNTANTAKTIASTATIATTTSTTTITTITTKNSFKFTPITFDKPTVSSASKAMAKPTPAEKDKKIQIKVDPNAERLKKEAERRLERSKRFGLKLDEKEMKEIRAARFGLMKAEKEKEKEKKPATVEEVLKKRAERFGLPLEEKKKASKKVRKAADLKKPVLKRIQQGRVAKSTVATAAARNNKVTATKSKVLDKKQQNINKLAEGAIRQTKKKIIDQRKVNKIPTPSTVNKINGRTITIQPEPTVGAKVVSVAKSLNTRRVETNPSVNNGRKIVINPDNKRKVSMIKQNTKPNNNKVANKKRRY
ncbi:uncharacterized protein B0P05DRAFT_587169 [Gilbertella persicaria]|nr:uncharacterized protein B0P05DRAFT_587169 [Gilbertella persicaria]KAI8078931.1 hypothetical protein B0P05DRAFT_587169 [Gilbertella persicaria]